MPHYGVNWDAISHLSRGQAFLHYYLTGEKNYNNVPNWNLYQNKEEKAREKTAGDALPRRRLYFQKVDSIFFSPDIPKNEIPRVSIYQYAGDVFGDIKQRYEYGHPHISDTLSSVFNLILFQKLGLINDIDSYRVYGVLLSSALVGLVFYWTASLRGKFAGLIAALALSTYPLFWAESHFNNEKDIPETVYWSFVMFSVWHGVTSRSWKWLLVSGVFFGLAIGTKFNILFSVFVIIPWLVAYLAVQYNEKTTFGNFFKQNTKLILSSVTAPFVGIAIVVGTWPLFWSDPLHKISRIVDFYKTIGTDLNIDPKFLGPMEINTYAPLWIWYTTPLVILFLAIVGIVSLAVEKNKMRRLESMFFMLWLIVPIARVTWPGTNIYGGVRQIMEYIPAMAIIAGVGGGILRDRLFPKRKLFSGILVLALFVPITLKLVQIHPNENVYFNPLIGGLKGARELDFPGWGASFGAPYREAIDWVNSNAEPGAKLTLGAEILSNIPGIFIRPDIDYKSNRSGYMREGEYIISLRSHGTGKRSYFDMYLDRMIEPVHEIVVDDVPILKVWKNDDDHLKPEWRNEVVLNNIHFSRNEEGVSFDMGQVVKLSRLEIKYDNTTCSELSWGYFMVSKDGKVWERVPGVLPEEVSIKTLGTQPSGGKLIEPFVGQEARYVNFFVAPANTCVTQIQSTKLYYFD